MSSTVMSNRCKNCGADLKFDPKTQKWVCEFCGTVFDIKDIEPEKKAEIEKDEADVKNANLEEYNCPNCGAVIITGDKTSSTSCVYCGTATVLKDRLEGHFKPNKIITFKNKKEDAMQAFEKYIKGMPFAPDEFSNKANIEKITGVYVPFWLFDCKTNGIITLRCQNIKSWRSGNYMYKKTDTYSCSRGGNMGFIDIPVDGSTNFPDDIMDSIEPYDYSQFTKFNYSYLSGFLAEQYDMEPEEVYERAKIRAENTTKDKLMETILGKYTTVSVTSENVNVQNGEIEYALLPVWMLNTLYKGDEWTNRKINW